MTKVRGNNLAGAGVGAAIAWFWNALVAAYAWHEAFIMPAEVAAVLGGLLGPVVSWAVGFLKEAPGNLPGNGTGDGHATDPQRPQNQTGDEQDLRSEKG